VSNKQGMLWKVAVVACLEVLRGLWKHEKFRLMKSVFG